MRLWKGSMWKAVSSGTDPKDAIDSVKEIEEPVVLLSKVSFPGDAARDAIVGQIH